MSLNNFFISSYQSWSRNYVNSFRDVAMLGGQPSAINMAAAVLRAIHRPNGGIKTDNLHVRFFRCLNYPFFL